MTTCESWPHDEKVSGTARVAYSLHILWYVQMVDYGYHLNRILTLLSSIVTLRFGMWSRSTRPLSCTRLLKKMQRMSVRDLDKMKPFHEKKERGFQIRSFERNDDNLAALRLVDRLARDVPQPARKDYMPFHPFHRNLQSHVLCSSNGWLQFPGPTHHHHHSLLATK